MRFLQTADTIHETFAAAKFWFTIVFEPSFDADRLFLLFPQPA